MEKVSCRPLGEHARWQHARWEHAGRRSRWLPSVAAALALGFLAGCGWGDSDQAACRCVEDSDIAAFPQCGDDLVVGRVDPECPFSSRVPECPSGKRLFLRDPTIPEAVLFNLRDSADGFRPLHSPDQLDERFVFVPDLDAIDLYLTGVQDDDVVVGGA